MKNFGLKFHHLGLATDNPKLTLRILKNIDINQLRQGQIKTIMLKI